MTAGLLAASSLILYLSARTGRTKTPTRPVDLAALLPLSVFLEAPTWWGTWLLFYSEWGSNVATCWSEEGNTSEITITHVWCDVQLGSVFQENMLELPLCARFCLSCQDNEKRTPLHAAAYLGDAEIIELLILSGRDLSIVYTCGQQLSHRGDSVMSAVFLLAVSQLGSLHACVPSHCSEWDWWITNHLIGSVSTWLLVKPADAIRRRCLAVLTQV